MKHIVKLYFTTSVEVEVEANGADEAIAIANDRAYDLAYENKEQLCTEIDHLEHKTEYLGHCDLTPEESKALELLKDNNGNYIRFTIEDNCPGDGWDGELTEVGCYMFGNNHSEGELFPFTSEEFVAWSGEIFEACEKALA